ncbi:chitin deacetylase [Gonapodya sp. JEL0774]|nr:chitin deacetylase [Gonapodya sp. JEL0774]
MQEASQRPGGRQEPPRALNIVDIRPSSRQDSSPRPVSQIRQDPPQSPSMASMADGPQRPLSQLDGGQRPSSRAFNAAPQPAFHRVSLSSYNSDTTDTGDEADLRRGFRAPAAPSQNQRSLSNGQGDHKDFSTLRSSDSGATLNGGASQLSPPDSSPPKNKSPTVLESSFHSSPPRRKRNSTPRWVFLVLIAVVGLAIIGGIGVAVVLILQKTKNDQTSTQGVSGIGVVTSRTTTAKVVTTTTTTTSADATPTSDPVPDMVPLTVGNVTFLPSGALPTGPLPDSVFRSCTVPGLVAMTFDDGPFQYTSGLLDVLDSLGVKVTFFINGRNQGDLTNPTYANLVKRAHDAGHCIGSHTWTHADLTTLTAAGVRNELQQIEDFMMATFGKRPNYMRPPYGKFNDVTVQVVKDMGYAAMVLWDQDTLDWAHPQDVVSSIQIYRNALATTNNAT